MSWKMRKSLEKFSSARNGTISARYTRNFLPRIPALWNPRMKPARKRNGVSFLLSSRIPMEALAPIITPGSITRWMSSHSSSTL
jgi:hypothetical protein